MSSKTSNSLSTHFRPTILFYINMHRLLKNSTLIIYDWDDTLFPASFIQKLGPMTVNSPEVRQKLFALETINIQLHVQSLELGAVLIVTNASTKWIDNSCSQYIPRLFDMLSIENVRVISARDICSHRSEDKFEWKRVVFKGLVRRFKDKSFECN